jgi:putative transcriptional regulator
VYAVLLFGSITIGRPLQDQGMLRTAVMVVPMIGFGLMIRAIARHVARIDEYQRKRLLETSRCPPPSPAPSPSPTASSKRPASRASRCSPCGSSWAGAGPRCPECAAGGPMKNLIRDLRGERGWSQAHLADLLSVSRQTVIAIETGRYDPSLPLAFTISKLFAQPIEAIFFPDQEPA